MTLKSAGSINEMVASPELSTTTTFACALMANSAPINANANRNLAKQSVIEELERGSGMNGILHGVNACIG
jgi:hypothetical protein